MVGDWGGWAIDSVATIGYVESYFYIKITNINPAKNQVCPDSTFLRNRLGIYVGNFTLGTYSTPSIFGADYVFYELSTTINDFQFFYIERVGNNLNITALPLNTNP